jgi:hypothetical protein
VYPYAIGGKIHVSRQSEELISVLLSIFEPATLAAQSNFLWINILAVGIISLVAVACAVALKKT